jgi:hypothetical protein
MTNNFCLIKVCPFISYVRGTFLKMYNYQFNKQNGISNHYARISPPKIYEIFQKWITQKNIIY